jgi:hypothetical protein
VHTSAKKGNKIWYTWTGWGKDKLSCEVYDSHGFQCQYYSFVWCNLKFGSHEGYWRTFCLPLQDGTHRSRYLSPQEISKCWRRSAVVMQNVSSVKGVNWNGCWIRNRGECESPFQKDWGHTPETVVSFRMKNRTLRSSIQGGSSNHNTVLCGQKVMGANAYGDWRIGGPWHLGNCGMHNGCRLLDTSCQRGNFILSGILLYAAWISRSIIKGGKGN